MPYDWLLCFVSCTYHRVGLGLDGGDNTALSYTLRLAYEGILEQGEGGRVAITSIARQVNV